MRDYSDKLNNSNIYILINIYINKLLEKFNLETNKEIIKSLHRKIYYKFFIKEMKEEIPYFSLYKRYFKRNLIQDVNFFDFMEDNYGNVDLIIKRKYYTLFFYKRYITRLYFI